jgi:hypothetical protein
MSKYGSTIFLRGREFTIAPLTKKQLERLWPKIKSVSTAMAKSVDEVDIPSVMGDACEVILAGLQGGGSAELTAEYIEGELIDVSNWGDAFSACLRVSNIRLVKADAGKLKALAQESQTGPESTGT